jgi:hypothetical protein
MIWRVTCRTGYFVEGTEYLVGFYRWHWLAHLAARLHLYRYPARECYLRRVHPIDWRS